jgi:hypothetical protein
MILIPGKLAINIKKGPNLGASGYTSEWPLKVGTDDENRPRIRYLTPWRLN